jgi:hypothetical protein
MPMGKIRTLSLLVICQGALAWGCIANAATELPSHDPLFASDGPLAITLKGPFKQLDRQRDKSADYAPGALSYIGSEGSIDIETSYRPRGNFRLQEENCSHAQLWLELKKKQTRDTLFANQKKLKLVVQCRDSKRYRGYLRKEYQAYRMLNTLTDASHRVRWAEVTYKDLDGKTLRTASGFFIEHKNRLADRLDLSTVDEQKISKTELDHEQATMMAMFNYFIGNADFSLIASTEGSCCHNAKLFQASEDEPYLPVIYDFDSSGYVNAPYAITPAKLNLRSVRQRLYRGFCVEPDIFDATLEAFQTHREVLLGLARETSIVNKRTSRKAVAYLQDFYEVIDDPDKLNQKVIEACR